MGFISTDKDHFVFMGDYFKLLEKSLKALDDVAGPLRYQFMTPDEAKKKKAIMEHQKQL